jgi:nucleotide-binding universal stress UspA family protein
MKTIQTILHPTDLTESARPALELALRLARDHGARLIVLHVAAQPVLYGELGMTIPLPEAQKEILEAARIKLECLTPGSGAECRVVEGVAAAEILHTARDESCDLIIMGTHGRRHIARVLLGSVAEQVLGRTPCPVLAIKPPAASEPTAKEAAARAPGAAPPLFPVILHPTDFSEGSRQAFDSACSLARGRGRLIVLHVVEPGHVGSEGYEDALFERLRSIQPDDRSIQLEYRLLEGYPVDQIISEAAASACDLIALGTHGRTGFHRLVMGSVAVAVLRRAGCPLLIVRASGQVPLAGTPSPLATTTFLSR